MIITGKYPKLRLRRSRKYSWSRRLVQENTLSYNDLVLPIFLIEGNNKKIPIKSMPGVFRYSINKLGEIIDKAIKVQIKRPMFKVSNRAINSDIDINNTIIGNMLTSNKIKSSTGRVTLFKLKVNTYDITNCRNVTKIHITILEKSNPLNEIGLVIKKFLFSIP